MEQACITFNSESFQIIVYHHLLSRPSTVQISCGPTWSNSLTRNYNFWTFRFDRMAIPSGYRVLELLQWIMIIRIAQAVGALVTFSVMCYGESIYSFDGDGLMLFTLRSPSLFLLLILTRSQGLATFIILTYILVSEFFF